MKIYVVTAGAYSDYSIVACCLDRKRADEIKAVHGKDDPYVDVEEFEDGVESEP